MYHIPSSSGDPDGPEQIGAFRDYLERCRGSAPIAPRSAFDPIDVPRLLARIFLLDVLDGGADFRYRLTGALIREHAPIDLTGRRLSEIAAIGSQAALLPLYRRAVAEAALVADRIPYRTPDLAADSHFDVAVAPLADSDGRLFQLIGVTVYAD